VVCVCGVCVVCVCGVCVCVVCVWCVCVCVCVCVWVCVYLHPVLSTQLHLSKRMYINYTQQKNINIQFCSVLYNYLHSVCISVVRHPDDGHISGRNMSLKNNNT